ERSSNDASRRFSEQGDAVCRPVVSQNEALRRLHIMTAPSNPAASFEPYRKRLLGLAYRMLGSMADANDAVQEAYLRWHGADREKVLEPRAFLRTTPTRICLDMLTPARARREEYVGPWLPEPVFDTAALAPDNRTELAQHLLIPPPSHPH